MKNPAKEACGPLPQEALDYLKKQANRDLTHVQTLTHKIHLCFEQQKNNEISKKEFSEKVTDLMCDVYGYVQDLSNLNTAFPTLFNDAQITILLDLMQLTTQLNLEFPNAENYSEFDNGQIGGAVTILQQQWAA